MNNNNVIAPLLSGVKTNAPPVKSDSKVGLYIFLGVIFIMAVLGLVAFGFAIKNIGDVDKMNTTITKETKINSKVSEKENSDRQIAAANMKRGSQGPPGIQGPPGPTGGVHAGAGPLLCVGQKKVATPVTGTSPFSIIYLDDRRYTPIQYWTLRNNPDGTVSVVNKFTGNCMTATTNTNDIYSDRCANPVH